MGLGDVGNSKYLVSSVGEEFLSGVVEVLREGLGDLEGYEEDLSYSLEGSSFSIYIGKGRLVRIVHKVVKAGMNKEKGFTDELRVGFRDYIYGGYKIPFSINSKEVDRIPDLSTSLVGLIKFLRGFILDGEVVKGEGFTKLSKSLRERGLSFRFNTYVLVNYFQEGGREFGIKNSVCFLEGVRNKDKEELGSLYVSVDDKGKYNVRLVKSGGNKENVVDCLNEVLIRVDKLLI